MESIRLSLGLGTWDLELELHLPISCNSMSYMKHTHGHTAPHTEDQHRHAFTDPQAVAQRLESPERDVWQKPEAVIAAFQIPRDATVAEIGAGTGYFVIRLARLLDHGMVIGLDTSPEMVDFLRQRAADLGLANLEARLVRPSEPIPLTEPVDLLLCADTYHHIPDRVSYLANFRTHLKPNGRLVIIDRPPDAPEGPPAEHRVSAEHVARELAEAGFTLVENLDFLQPYQYYLAFTLTEPSTKSG
jgi:SAM-dependent methyltransferase